MKINFHKTHTTILLFFFCIVPILTTTTPASAHSGFFLPQHEESHQSPTVAPHSYLAPGVNSAASAEPVAQEQGVNGALAEFQLGDLPRLIDQGGWGPNELNTSVGEEVLNDGNPMTINGVGYSHGIGTHATSVISFDLEQKCTSLTSWVGVDDEVEPTNGSIIFQIFADGQQIFDSGTMTGADPAKSTGTLNMTNVSELMLIVQDAGFYGSDHANWAEPVLTCSSQPNGNGDSVKHIRGSWGPVLQWPVKAIHASLLPSGHIISHASADPGYIGNNDPNAPHNSTKVDLSDIDNWSHEWVDHPSEEMYCSAHTLLPDGSLFEFGGHGGAYPNEVYSGQDQASRFDFASKSWIQMADMQQARWYPTALTLGNGDVMSIGGSHAAGNSFTPEIFNGTSWRSLDNVNYQNRVNNNDHIFDHTYPFVHLVSDGRVFWAGWDETMSYINTDGDGAWSQNYFRENLQRAWGSPIMYRVDKLLLVGGVDHQGDFGTATHSVSHIDLAGSTPSVSTISPMLFPRTDSDGTILANGDVFMNGGGYYHFLGHSPTHIYVPETWDPATDKWTLGAAAANPRGYHSSTLLLPDGRIWTGGGECGDECNKGKTAQVYTPPYLYKNDGSGTLAARPVINSVDETVSYGATLNANITTSNGVSKVTLIRLGSTTHHINFEQRYLELSYTLNGSALTMTAPANGNLAPPGFYMLFLFDNSGVPSVAKMVQLINDDSGNLSPESSDWIKVDDRDSMVSYNANWLEWNDNPGHSGTETYCETSGCAATFTFSGTQARYYGFQRNDLGVADIYVDGILQTSIDLYSSFAQYDVLLYETDLLANGTHTLEIQVSGNSNNASSGFEIIVDAFEFRNAPGNPLGDVSCDGVVDAIDALEILQYDVALRTDAGSCLSSDRSTTLNARIGDVNDSGATDAVDAMLILQCDINVENVFCP